MRLEQVTAEALKKVNFDRYLLASAVGKRADALAKGAQPQVDLDPKKNKYADIALHEIAEGKIIVGVES